MTYYDEISKGYDELHGEEQRKKMSIIKSLVQVTHNDRLLDVGCGSGISSDFDCVVNGIDTSQNLVKVACDKGVDAAVGEAENLPFDDDSFDFVISVTAIMNFSDIQKSVSEMARVCKKDGTCIISFLKNSSKKEEILKAVQSYFYILKEIEEEKDIILMLRLTYGDRPEQ